MVIIQVIRTTWTKRSRGHPGSVARAAVPEAMVVAGVDATGPVVVDSVVAVEHDGFAPTRTSERFDGIPARVANVVVDADAAVVTVTRKAELGRGWPTRRRDVHAFDLAVGETGRLLRNHRMSGSSIGWSYEKVVVNVAFLEAFDAGVFTRGQPTHVLDEQESLF